MAELDDILKEEEKETPKEEVPKKEIPKEPTISPEALELFNSVKEEVGEKRFDGLMSAWQEDRRRMLDLEEEVGTLRDVMEQTPIKKEIPETPPEDEAWINYLRGKIRAKDAEEQYAEDEIVERELNATLTDFPGLTADEILKFAIKYSGDENNPMSLYSAAEILTEMKEGKTVTKEMIEEEKKRKREAALGLPGGTEITTPPGLRPWSKEKDKGKSLRDLGREGEEELGIK